MQAKYIPSLVVLAVIHAYRLGRWQTWTIAKRLRTACVVSGVRLASVLKRPVDEAACPPIFGEASNATKKSLAWTRSAVLLRASESPPDVLMALDGKDRQNQDRQELDTLLDLLTPSQLQLAIQVSKLIYAYKPGPSLATHRRRHDTLSPYLVADLSKQHFRWQNRPHPPAIKRYLSIGCTL